MEILKFLNIHCIESYFIIVLPNSIITTKNTVKCFKFFKGFCLLKAEIFNLIFRGKLLLNKIFFLKVLIL